MLSTCKTLGPMSHYGKNKQKEIQWSTAGAGGPRVWQQLRYTVSTFQESISSILVLGSEEWQDNLTERHPLYKESQKLKKLHQFYNSPTQSQGQHCPWEVKCWSTSECTYLKYKSSIFKICLLFTTCRTLFSFYLIGPGLKSGCETWQQMLLFAELSFQPTCQVHFKNTHISRAYAFHPSNWRQKQVDLNPRPRLVYRVPETWLTLA